MTADAAPRHRRSSASASSSAPPSRGTLMGPQALRTAGLVRALADLGHRVADRGTLYEAEPVAVAMEPRARRALPPPRPRSPAGRGALHDHAYAMAARGGCRSSSAATTRSRWARSAASPATAPSAGREIAVLWLDAHADYNTPETTPSRQHARHGARLPRRRARSCAPLLGEPAVPPGRAREHPRLRRPLDRPGREARGSRPHGVDTVDMRADRRARRLCAARRAHRALAGARRPPARQLRRRLPRPGGRARHRAPWCRAAPPTARRTWSWRCSATPASSARSTWSS